MKSLYALTNGDQVIEYRLLDTWDWIYDQNQLDFATNGLMWLEPVSVQPE